MKNFKFKKGPLLCAHFFTKKDLIQKITLSASSQFEATIQGDATPSSESSIFQWLKSYQDSQSLDSLPLDFSTLTIFQKEVLLALRKLPFGQIISYKQLAKLSSSPKAYRAVGSTCKKNPFPLLIPCHRVVSSSGAIGNFLYGKRMKLDLLKFEKSWA